MKNLTKLGKNCIGIVILVQLLQLVQVLASSSSSNRNLVQSTSASASSLSSSNDDMTRRFLRRSNYRGDDTVIVTNNRILDKWDSCDLENNFFYRWSYQGKHQSSTSTSPTPTRTPTPNPWWFSYNEAFYKDFSPYVEEKNDGNDMDYTSLLEHFRATCEIGNGGIMYAISGSQSCITTTTTTTIDEEGDGTTTTTTATTTTIYSDTNLPICLGSDCTTSTDIFSSSTSLLKDSSVLNYCSKKNGEEKDTATVVHVREEFNYQIEKVDSLIGEECKAELGSFSSKVGYGTPDYLWAMVDLREYCTQDSHDVETCDFKNATNDFVSDCEEEDGVLYVYSDYWYDGERNFTSFYLNQPLCIGRSCDVENYFEKFIFAHNTFDLSGSFYRATTTTGGRVEVVGNITHEYYPISYQSTQGESSAQKTETETETESSSWPILVSSASRLPIAIDCGSTLILLIWFLYH